MPTAPMQVGQPDRREDLAAPVRRTSTTSGTTRCPTSTRPTRRSATTPSTASTTSIDNYFNSLLTPADHQPSGKLEDQFSFTYPTLAWDQLINSGSTVGYGIEWRLRIGSFHRATSASCYVHAGSPAATRRRQARRHAGAGRQRVGRRQHASWRRRAQRRALPGGGHQPQLPLLAQPVRRRSTSRCPPATWRCSRCEQRVHRRRRAERRLPAVQRPCAHRRAAD